MSLITKLRKTIKEAREYENMQATIAQQAVLIDVLAVLADVDPEDIIGGGDEDEE